MVPYIEALLRLPPQLRRRPPALTRSPSKSLQQHHQPPLSPTSSSSNASAAITATVLDRHHRHHPLGQAALRFLLYLEEAYAAAPTAAAAAGDDDTDPQKDDDEEEADYPLLLDGMATDVSRFLTYMEAGARLAWPRLAATRCVGGWVYRLGRVAGGACLWEKEPTDPAHRSPPRMYTCLLAGVGVKDRSNRHTTPKHHTNRPDALTLLRRDLHRAAFTLLAPPILGLCQRAHAATEVRLLGRAAACGRGHGRGRGRGGLAVG